MNRPAAKAAAPELRFECQPGCSKCCEQQGFVYLTEEDVTRLSTHLKMAALDFERRYVYRTANLLRFRVPRHAQCEFLDNGRCGVHEVKPVQCRTFPFWPELTERRRAWHETGKWCPGVGKGELITIEEASRKSEEMRAAHPRLYRSP